MNDNQYRSQARQYAGGNSYLEEASQAQISSVLRNTYTLLALTLAFSTLTCFVGMAMGVGRMNIFVLFAGFYGLSYLISKNRNSSLGLVLTFVFTGFLGFTLAPVINMYLRMTNGAQIVGNALALTAFAFFGLSAFVLITRKNMSFLYNFLAIGFFVIMGTVVIALVSGFLGYQISGLILALNAAFVLFSSAMILYQTSAIINGGETNYIMATVTLFISIYNLFLSLLSILGFASGD